VVFNRGRGDLQVEEVRVLANVLNRLDAAPLSQKNDRRLVPPEGSCAVRSPSGPDRRESTGIACKSAGTTRIEVCSGSGYGELGNKRGIPGWVITYEPDFLIDTPRIPILEYSRE